MAGSSSPRTGLDEEGWADASVRPRRREASAKSAGGLENEDEVVVSSILLLLVELTMA